MPPMASLACDHRNRNDDAFSKAEGGSGGICRKRKRKGKMKRSRIDYKLRNGMRKKEKEK